MDASAALNRQQIVAGLLAGTAMLGLVSCSNTVDPGPVASPTQVEQTVTPTVQPNPDASATPWVTPGPDAGAPAESEYPALSDAASYVFSETPQSAGEQFIFDNYPHMWDEGIRAVSDTATMWATNMIDREPGALVQYINGTRYEGTEAMPLGFRGQLDDPESFPTDTFEARKSAILDGSQTPLDVGNTGQGGYQIAILENPGDLRGRPGSDVSDENDTVLNILRTSENGAPGGAQSKVFGSWEEAWDYVQKDNFTPNFEGARPLSKGEIANVAVKDAPMSNDGTNGDVSFLVLNPTTGKFETVVSYDG